MLILTYILNITDKKRFMSLNLERANLTVNDDGLSPSQTINITDLTELVNGSCKNQSGSVDQLQYEINWSWGKTILFLVQIVIMVETILGNLLVICAVKVEKKLQTPFNYYIVNLAFTDMNVGLFVMSLFTITNLFEFFPFGNLICGFWVWCDYAMTFESVMTLAAISIDRFWSVTFTLHYRNHNSDRKSLLIIAGTWIIVALLWLPSFTYDRLVNEYAPGECYFDSQRNKYLVIYLGILGYYLPLFVMIGAYARILFVVRKRAAQVKSTQTKVEVATVNETISNKFSESDMPYDGTSSSRPQKAEPLQKAQPLTSIQDQRLKREQKAVYTLLNIVVLFLICWIPFYILFVSSAWNPALFPTWYVNFSYWMAYINSAINPILYPLSSQEFRSAYKKVLLYIACRGNKSF